MTSNALPSGPSQATGESSMGFGLRVLGFILETQVTATLTNEALELADYAAGFAVTAREILPLAVTRISEVRHTIHLVLKSRQPTQPTQPTSAAAHVDKPNLGPMAHLAPQPIQRPPSGNRVAVDDIAF